MTHSHLPLDPEGTKWIPRPGSPFWDFVWCLISDLVLWLLSHGASSPKCYWLADFNGFDCSYQLLRTLISWGLYASSNTVFLFCLPALIFSDLSQNPQSPLCAHSQMLRSVLLLFLCPGPKRHLWHFPNAVTTGSPILSSLLGHLDPNLLCNRNQLEAIKCLSYKRKWFSVTKHSPVTSVISRQRWTELLSSQW